MKHDLITEFWREYIPGFWNEWKTLPDWARDPKLFEVSWVHWYYKGGRVEYDKYWKEHISWKLYYLLMRKVWVPVAIPNNECLQLIQEYDDENTKIALKQAHSNWKAAREAVKL